MGNESINWDKLGFDYISRTGVMASGTKAP